MLETVLKIGACAALATALALPGAHAEEKTPLPEKFGIAATISGTLTYRERMALPPGAVAIVQLQDVSRADAPAAILGEQHQTLGGQVPVPFRVDYDAAKIEPRNSYNISARIEHDGRLLFVSDTRTPVITRGHPMEADLVLKKVAPKQ